MALTSIDHYFVYAADLEASREFYEKALGLEVGYRPPFNFAGYWLYLGGRPCVHLGTATASEGLADYLGEHAAGRHEHTGAVDHIAFRGEDFPAYKQRLDTLGIAYRHRVVPDMQLDQLFVKDPDGVTVELNFLEPVR